MQWSEKLLLLRNISFEIIEKYTMYEYNVS